MNNSLSASLEVLRIPCHKPLGIIHSEHIELYKKNGHLITGVRIYKYTYCILKSGTALLLFRLTGSGIAIGSEQATPKPTPICTNTHMPNYSMYEYEYTYPEDIKMLQCLGTKRIYQIR